MTTSNAAALVEPTDGPDIVPIKILIIDDTELDRKLFSGTLRTGASGNYELHEASDIPSGLEACASLQPDCVLLDYMLQGEVGLDWIEECKARAGNPHLPVIMLTGAGDEALAVSAFHAGAADYLPKARASAAALERAIGNALQKADLYRSVEMERARREAMHEQLAQKNEELQSLYHTVSHELKTPLTAAREFVSLLLDEVGGPLTETQREFLETTEGCCDRLSFLLNNWLDTVRSETGKLQLNLGPVAIDDIVGQTAKTYDVLAKKEGIKLETDINDVGHVPADAERLQQTLANLLSNAFKFTDADGQVTVSCRTVGDEVQIAVADTGRGIEAQHQEQIFSPFFQSEKNDTSEAKGMGLGLHVCRTIVELHGGRMSLESQVGRGSTFTIHLPKRGLPRESSK
jgi:signal transduction histidine kinase